MLALKLFGAQMIPIREEIQKILDKIENMENQSSFQNIYLELMEEKSFLEKAFSILAHFNRNQTSFDEFKEQALKLFIKFIFVIVLK